MPAATLSRLTVKGPAVRRLVRALGYVVANVERRELDVCGLCGCPWPLYQKRASGALPHARGCPIIYAHRELDRWPGRWRRD